jgi:hypothetical protein
VSLSLPAYVSGALQSGETLISYIPEPDLTARRRIILALFPLFVVLIIILAWFFNARTSAIAGAAAVYCAVALFVFALRLSRTSYAISARRVLRFVSGKIVQDVACTESRKPCLPVFSESNFFLSRWMASFVSIGQIVEINRIMPNLMTFKSFFSSHNSSQMRIGYPGHCLAIPGIFDDVTLAWAAAQDTQ